MLVAALLGAPLAMTFLAPERDWMLADESRPRATMPGVPHSLSDWRILPGELDAYLGDHFGFRHAMIHTQGFLAHLILQSGNALVQIGTHGLLFYQGDDMLRQSAGLLMRAAAGPLSRLRRSTAFGPPSPGSGSGLSSLPRPIPPPSIPTSFHNGRATPADGSEYDLMLDASRAEGSGD